MTAPKPVDVVFVHGLFSSAKAWASFTDLISLDPDLAGFIRVHCPSYSSPRLRLRPDRRIAEIDDLGDWLATYLSAELPDAATPSPLGVLALSGRCSPRVRCVL
jgi:hypothetical protein